MASRRPRRVSVAKTHPHIDPSVMRAELSDDEIAEMAREAVKKFRAELPFITSYAQAVTKNPGIKVALHAGPPCTDGKTIFLRPPIKLGEMLDHVKSICGDRDDDGILICPACNTQESVQTTIRHEIAHIVGDSFASLSEFEQKELVVQTLNEWGAADGTTRAGKIKRAIERMNPQTFVEAATIVSPFMHPLVNAMEDARVNKMMFEARPGTYKMFRAQTTQVLQEGNERPDGTHAAWGELPPNVQAIIGVYAAASGVPTDGFFSPDVEALMNDPKFKRLIAKVQDAKSVREIYRAGFPVLELLREHGFCKMPDDLEDDPPPPPPMPPGPAMDEVPPPPANASDEQQQESEPQDGEGGGDGEPQDDDESKDDSSDGSADADGADDAEGDDDADDDADAGSGDDDDLSGDDDATGGDADDDAEDAADDADDDGAPGNGDGADGDGEEDDDDAEGDDGSGDAEGTGGGGGDDDAEDDDEGDDADGTGSSGTGDGDDDFDDDEWDDDDDAEGDASGGDGSGSGSGDYEDEDEDWDADDLGGDQSGLGGVPDFDAEQQGTPDDVEEAMRQFGGHEDFGTARDEGGWGNSTPDEHRASRTGEQEEIERAIAQNEIDRAIAQADFFDEPSRNIWTINVWEDDGDPQAPGWSEANHGWRLKDIAPPPESMMAPALQQMRLTFQENKKSGMQRNMKSGRINTKVLGRRANAEIADPRLFQKKRVPEERDYFVVVAVDVSGSTQGWRIDFLKEAVLAQGDLLHRAGVPFAVYMHSGTGAFVDIHVVKSDKQKWDADAKERLRKIYSFGTNVDGHALEFFRKVAERQSATDRIILYFTDGAMPAANPDEELVVLQREIGVCKRLGIHLVGVGVCTDSPRQHGLDTIEINGTEDLPELIRGLRDRLIGAPIR